MKIIHTTFCICFLHKNIQEIRPDVGFSKSDWLRSTCGKMALFEGLTLVVSSINESVAKSFSNSNVQDVFHLSYLF